MTKLKTTSALYKDERMWFFVALGLLGLMFALYVYFVFSSVVHVVMRKEINKEITDVSSRVSQLESDYMKSQHEVSKEFASHDGYTEVSEKTFITRTADTLTLSRQDEG